MIKHPSATFSILILGILLLTSCSSARTYQHQFNNTNRAIVRHVLEAGTVACQNCWINANCPTITDSVVSKDKYELTGKCALYAWNISMESLDNGAKFNLHVKCQLILGRNKTSEGYFLDEVTAALFNMNQLYIKSTNEATQQKPQQ